MQRRRSIYLDGFGHKNPIPAACMIDGLLMTGIIYGQDPETGKAADGLERLQRPFDPSIAALSFLKARSSITALTKLRKSRGLPMRIDSRSRRRPASTRGQRDSGT